MKTKDIIRLLQEADPSGETHVRFEGDGDVVEFVRVPGYYDGSYTYVDGDKLIQTDKGSKIDAYTWDIKGKIWDFKGDLEKIKEGIILDFRDEEKAKKIFEEEILPEAQRAREFCQGLLFQFIVEVLQKIKEGWIITQPLDTTIGHYNQMVFKKGKEEDRLCQGECGAVLESGFFEVEKTNEYYVWKVIFNKGV